MMIEIYHNYLNSHANETCGNLMLYCLSMKLLSL